MVGGTVCNIESLDPIEAENGGRAENVPRTCRERFGHLKPLGQIVLEEAGLVLDSSPTVF